PEPPEGVRAAERQFGRILGPRGELSWQAAGGWMPGWRRSGLTAGVDGGWAAGSPCAGAGRAG
ncbi:MAG: hypothetical protein OXG65_02220, partial [Chloroflexi bacterium]|nr:hypothetical protein [Chloroflexota bacterium]